MADALESYQLKITLRDSKPSIWRRVVVPSDLTLNQVHDVIQRTFGWLDYHLHSFKVGKAEYGIPDPDRFDDDEMQDDRGVRLREVAKLRSKLFYEYDFGDEWEHEIVVEKVIAKTDDTPSCTCTDGARAAPPEDSGGVWGYQEKLAILKNPKHEDHADILEWMGDSFTPDAFDRDEINRDLAALVAAWTRKPRAKSKSRARR